MLENVKIFADGADLSEIARLAADPSIRGFTTNPTLMRQGGVDDYEAFGREMLGIVGDRPVSFEVFADEPAEMTRQALKLASWGENVYVKVPVTNSEGESTDAVVRTLSGEGVRVNVTAVFTPKQVEVVTDALAGGPPSYVSVFAGRIADAGVDPIPLVREALETIGPEPQIELIWASPREVLNLVQADRVGCHIITVTADLLKKLALLGKDLTEFSLDTVRMFATDAASAGYSL
jgi:transaldolase